MRTPDRSHPRAGRIKTRILTGVTVVLALTSCVLTTWAQDPGPVRRIYDERTPIELVRQYDRIAVRYAAGLPAEQIDAAVSRQPELASAEQTEVIDFGALKTCLYRLPAPVPADGWRALTDRLIADPAVDFATPVYQHAGSDLMPTGELFVQLDADAPKGFLEELLRLHRLELVEKTSWREGNYRLRPAPDSPLDVIASCEALLTHPEVVFSHPNFLGRVEEAAAPNDPLYADQWNLDNRGLVEDADLDAAEGWEIQEAWPDVKIAILDDGFDIDHPDLLSNVDTVNMYDFADNDANPRPVAANDTHGTRCAGLALATPNNGIGIAGVAGGARLLPLRIWANHVFDAGVAANAIAYAYIHGADVISCSWSWATPFSQVNAAIHDAVAFGRAGHGSVVVFSAGNQNLNSVRWPARLPETIAVAATSMCDERKDPGSCDGEAFWGSNYGDSLDVAAPGVGLTTTDVGGGYVHDFNGTSAATPQVAGLAALLICQYPSWEGTEIRARIEQTCDKVHGFGNYNYDATTGKCPELGHGRINVYRALSGKPQVALTPQLPAFPSVYRDYGDAEAPYPEAYHETSAYEWLGEEFSPEADASDATDPDGAPNLPRRDGFDDGIRFHPPYIPGQIGSIDIRVSVEDPNSPRFQQNQLWVNCWFDWQCDGSWDFPRDYKGFQIPSPSTWGGLQSKVFNFQFTVPSDDIGWHIQSSDDAKFLNVRARLGFGQNTSPSAPDTCGEVEDYRFVNFVEMFDTGAGYMDDHNICIDTWRWYDDEDLPWLQSPCPPLFLMPDGPPRNGFMSANTDRPTYDADDQDQLRTPSFDFSEMTQASLLFEHSAIELIYGRVSVYVNGLLDSVLVVYNGVPTTPPACGLVLPEILPLDHWCGDGYDDVYLSFEVDHDEPCGLQFPAYQDWFLDNVVVVATDEIAPAEVTAYVDLPAAHIAEIQWPAVGDDGYLRQAELYNIRYGPEAIVPDNWRHSLWLRPDMVAALPVPQPPGSQEDVVIRRLSPGLHVFSVRTLDEVNWIGDPDWASRDRAPVQTAPGLLEVVAGDSVVFDVTAFDPDHDPVLLYATQRPPASVYVDHGDGTATFGWRPSLNDLGPTSVIFVARDWNGRADRDTTILNIVPYQEPTYSDHNVGTMEFSVTDEGILGFLDATQAEGSGLIYPRTGPLPDGTNHLYIGGLWVGADTSYVANRDFDADPEKEWFVARDGETSVEEVGSKQTIRATFNDSAAADPRGLTVNQESWAYSDPSTDDDFVIVRYTVTNAGSTDLTGLYLGLFLDLDIQMEGGDDVAGIDATRDLAYATDAGGIYVGARRLTDTDWPVPLSNVTLIPNVTYVYPEEYILDSDKFAFLSAADDGHVITDGSTPDDYSLLISVGPFDLATGDSVRTAFAVIGGEDFGALTANADQAQAVYDAVASDVAEANFELYGAPRLLPIRPNPTPLHAQVHFTLPQGGPVRIDVFDAGGRRVRRLINASRPPGPNVVPWDSEDERGHRVGSGLYFIRMVTPQGAQSRTVVITR